MDEQGEVINGQKGERDLETEVVTERRKAAYLTRGNRMKEVL